MTDLNLKVQQDMIEDGWRQCAKGQRTTQYCGMMEKAVADKQAEIDKLRAALKNAADGFDEAADDIYTLWLYTEKDIQRDNDLDDNVREYYVKANKLRELLTRR